LPKTATGSGQLKRICQFWSSYALNSCLLQAISARRRPLNEKFNKADNDTVDAAAVGIRRDGWFPYLTSVAGGAWK
jgi:hypothetical protein